MGPRKRSKPNPKAEAEAPSQASSGPSNSDPQLQKSVTASERDSVSPAKADQPDSAAGVITPQSAKPWYGGTWSRKATPITQVAKESIVAAGGAASEAVSSARAQTPEPSSIPLKSPTAYLSQGRNGSSRSTPLAATTTKLNVTSNPPKSENLTASEGPPANPDSSNQERTPKTDTQLNTNVEKPDTTSSDQDKLMKDNPEAYQKRSLDERNNGRGGAASWLTWFSKVEDPRDDTIIVSAKPNNDHNGDAVVDHPGDTTTELREDAQQGSRELRRNSDPNPLPPVVQDDIPPRSWLSLWGNPAKPVQSYEGTKPTTLENKSDKSSAQAREPDPTPSDPVITDRPSLQPTDVGKSYGWAFWSREQSKSGNGDRTNHAGNEPGGLAQAASVSESDLGNAIVDKARDVPIKVEKRQRPQSLDASGDSKKPRGADVIGKKIDPDNIAFTPSKDKSANGASATTRRLSDNLLLPAIKQTYNVVSKPGLVQQLSLLLQLGTGPEPKHVSIVQNPHRIKRALAIGIHGYFPAPLIRSVLGQPTGTSIRFANSAADAIKKWTHDQGYSCEVIEKVALEGEGKIAERIDLLWKLMLNWIEKIRKADFVMIACHSQGVPVALMLTAKLISFGCLNSTKVGVCAMAGVNMGPFGDYKSRWISGSAGELFDFAQPDSQVSKDYKTALDICLRFGVKIVYIGSIDDQLVSLESSTFGSISHPSIYRAVFIDGRIHAPDFLTHLVGFALKLRNLGISDHGLIRELSTPLAGSLYTGEGHSRVYDDEAVYYLAVQHALETTTAGNVSLQTHLENPIVTQNPYILPFAMRGLLEEEFVRRELHGEVTELIKQFDAWKPSSKVLKDVKFRLEGVRSKL